MYPYSKIHAKFDWWKLRLKRYFNGKTSSAPILFVTGASENHFKTLLQLLCNLSGLKIKNPDINVVVWDLGLTSHQIEFLKIEFKDFQYQRFEFEKYPEWFNVKKEAGQYAWKPQIIAASVELANKLNRSFLCWVDSGDLFSDPDLQDLMHYLDSYDVYSPASSGSMRQWTHPKTLDFLNVDQWRFSVMDLPMRNGAFLAFNLQRESVRQFIVDFQEKSAIRECIAPLGSDRSNHRQDQAVFSLLYYQYLYRYKRPYNNRYLGFTIHNDIDN
jgi:hypothetical protein